MARPIVPERTVDARGKGEVRRCSILDAGCSILDTGYSRLEKPQIVEPRELGPSMRWDLRYASRVSAALRMAGKYAVTPYTGMADSEGKRLAVFL